MPATSLGQLLSVKVITDAVHVTHKWHRHNIETHCYKRESKGTKHRHDDSRSLVHHANADEEEKGSCTRANGGSNNLDAEEWYAVSDRNRQNHQGKRESLGRIDSCRTAAGSMVGTSNPHFIFSNSSDEDSSQSQIKACQRGINTHK